MESEPTHDSLPHRPSDSSSGDPHVDNTRRLWNPLTRAILGIIVGSGSITVLQSIAPEADHQNANMSSLAIGLLSVVFVIYQLHRAALQRGHKYLIPVCCFVSAILFATLVQYDGLSGEVLPQFRYRFAKRLQPKTFDSELDRDAQSPTTTASSDIGSSRDGESLGFLGNDRTPVISHRGFSIPSDASQIDVLWNQGIGQGWSGFAVTGGRAITLEQRDQEECVTCYRLADGEPEWVVSHTARHENPLGGVGPRSTPVIHGERVYAQGATGRVWCIDLQSGQTRWSVDLLAQAGWDQAASEAEISWGRAGSPLIVDGLCVVPFGAAESQAQSGRSLIALDSETGDIRWTAGEFQISYASPTLMTLDRHRQIVSVNENAITGHEIETGRVLWEFPWPGLSNADANCATPVPCGNARFLVGKGYGGGSAVVEIRSSEDGGLSAEAVWESTRVLKTKFNHACVDGDTAYAISNGALEAVAIADGRRLWRQPRRWRFGQGQVYLVEDILVAQSEPGDVVLVAVDETEYRELLRIPALDSKTWNLPTIAGRHLLVRNDRQVISFLLPEREP